MRTSEVRYTTAVMVSLSLIVFALLQFAGCGCGSTKSTWNAQGLKVVVYRPSLSKGENGALSAKGKTQYYSSWQGLDGRHRINWSLDGMRLNVNGKDFGPVNKGDTIELYANEVRVNGRKRK